MDFHVTCVVVGAGAVGLSIARTLARAGHDCLLLEKQKGIGQGVSSRNSEVIHAGIYYPEDSTKAKLCVRGKSLLYDFCNQFSVPHHNCGKLIVATDQSELKQLDQIYAQANANGVTDLTAFDHKTVQQLEPNVRAIAALFSPSTGILSAHDYMLALLGDFEFSGGTVSTQAELLAVSRDPSGYRLTVAIGSDTQPFHLTTRAVVNASGLGAQALASRIEGLPEDAIPKLHYCRGNYFSLQGSNPFQHLIYPVPPQNGAGLGIHATIDLGGKVKFGPDVEYIDDESYEVNANRLALYCEAVKRYYPGLDDKKLVPSYAGIRPKLQGPKDEPADFVIREESNYDLPNIVNLFGIESPGLTASLAIAEEVEGLLAL